MTDQPHDPAEPTPDEPTPPPPAVPDARPRRRAARGPPVPPGSPAGPPAAGRAVRRPAGGPPGTRRTPLASGHPHGPGRRLRPAGYPGYQQPGYPQAPADNPYGGYSQAPVYAGGGGPAYPGSLAYVEQNFGKVADFGQRALAYLIDIALTLIGLVPAIIGIIVLVAVGAPTRQTDRRLRQHTVLGRRLRPGLAVMGGLLIALGALISIGITIWNRVFKMGRTGQSVGKKVIGLYLLDDKTGQPIGAGMCFLRELVQSLVNQIFYLGWLWMLWDADKQTLGDKSVHSNVVVLPKA